MYTSSDMNTPEAVHPRPRPEYPGALRAEVLRALFADCADYQQREVLFGLDEKRRLSLCWLDGLVSGELVAEQILRPLTDSLRADSPEDQQQSLERILSGAVYSHSAKCRESLDELVGDLMHGSCALLFDGIEKAISFELRSGNVRAVGEPSLEKSIKGAKDAFVETLRVNTGLVRRRLCTPALKLRELTVGRKSHTRLDVLYVDGVAAPDTVESLCARLEGLDVDGLLATGLIEESVTDAPRSIFPQLLHTERPDRFSLYLLEGRVGLLIDGLPIGLVLPVNFAEFMQVTGDHCNNYLVATALTVLRYLALALSLLFPALYVAIALYHQEMLPTRLLLSVIEAKRNVPFSTALEVLGMLVSFELLQEAGLHLPNPIGDTVSIIGALIVGQSAVEARVVSPIAIIVVAFAGIAGYTLPSQDLGAAIRLLRFALVLAAIAAGLFGVGAALCLLLLHLAQIDSFGRNYTAPLSDGEAFPLLRLLLRPPKTRDKLRDPALEPPDRRRQA